jgi:hypothetical protein
VDAVATSPHAHEVVRVVESALRWHADGLKFCLGATSGVGTHDWALGGVVQGDCAGHGGR